MFLLSLVRIQPGNSSVFWTKQPTGPRQLNHETLRSMGEGVYFAEDAGSDEGKKAQREGQR